MTIPEVTKDALVAWLKSKEPAEIVGTSGCGTGCLLFNYFAETDTPAVLVNPSYDPAWHKGTIHYVNELRYTEYRRMTPFENQVGNEFDHISRFLIKTPVDAARALALPSLADA